MMEIELWPPFVVWIWWLPDTGFDIFQICWWVNHMVFGIAFYIPNICRSCRFFLEAHRGESRCKGILDNLLHTVWIKGLVGITCVGRHKCSGSISLVSGCRLILRVFPAFWNHMARLLSIVAQLTCFEVINQVPKFFAAKTLKLSPFLLSFAWNVLGFMRELHR